MLEILLNVISPLVVSALALVSVIFYVMVRETGFARDQDKSHAALEKKSEEYALLIDELKKQTNQNEILYKENETLQLFSRQASHDGIDYLHAALAGITNLTDAIENEGAWEQKLVFVRHDLMQVQYLLENMKWIFQLENKNAPSHKSLLNLRGLIRDTLIPLSVTGREQGVEVKFNDKNDIPDVWGDPHQLGLMLRNLVDNGIKYKSAHVKQSEVVTSVFFNDNIVQIEIADNGRGMTDLQREQILKSHPYTRQGTAQGEIRGSGLGMMIVQKVIENHEGSLIIDSTYEKGATLTVQLPLPLQQDQIGLG